MVCLLTLAVYGACGVVLLAVLLGRVPRFGQWRTGARLALAHSLVVVGFLAVAPLYIRANWGSPYGDIYGPYLLVPGIHIYHPANRLFADSVFHWLLNHMESFPASVLCVIVGPGLIGLAVGGVQWWLIGAAWDRFGRRVDD